MKEPLLRVARLTKVFPLTAGVLRRRRGEVRAVDRVSFQLERGETLGLVGESGSGKSTVARCLLRLTEPTRGSVVFDGEDVGSFSREDLRRYRREVQLVFQDPFGALNPRMTVAELVAEPLRAHGLVEHRRDTRRRVGQLLEMVALEESTHGGRYPRELSGGQRQRVVIARALGLRPRVLVLDEPVSGLDVSVGAQVLDLLANLQSELGVAYLLISHDLSMVRQVAHRVAVMYLGAIMEVAEVDDLFRAPHHPYTQALLSAVPVPDPVQERSRRRIPLSGEVPTGLDIPPACRFHTRCFKARQVCSEEEPPLGPVAERDHRASCLFAEPMQVL